MADSFARARVRSAAVARAQDAEHALEMHILRLRHAERVRMRRWREQREQHQELMREEDKHENQEWVHECERLEKECTREVAGRMGRR